MSKHKTVLVFGATGLVGQKLVNLLVDDERYIVVRVANRRTKNYTNAKIEEVLVDFDHLAKYADSFKVDDVFICLGTTIKKAGSKSAFEKVDLEYPTEIARMAKQNQVAHLVHISAIGANSKSSNFYTKTKGRAEEAVWQVGPENSYTVRPSMLFGDREEFRLGEKIGIALMKTLGFLMVGPANKYKGIYDEEVAQAMIFIANAAPKQKAFNSSELKAIATNF
ncbi:NAD(P)H-binding protein [Vicingaceae bacterium]|nr:NAD(P)H-binding protein [Vicingaceae bacterium]